MTILPPLNREEYEAVKRVIAEFDRAEKQLGRLFRDHPHEGFRLMDEARLQMRAAVEGYEATRASD